MKNHVLIIAGMAILLSGEVKAERFLDKAYVQGSIGIDWLEKANNSGAILQQ